MARSGGARSRPSQTLLLTVSEDARRTADCSSVCVLPWCGPLCPRRDRGAGAGLCLEATGAQASVLTSVIQRFSVCSPFSSGLSMQTVFTTFLSLG